jgi:MFS transporter, PAT family, beta-lactamase induction signal transducer AmpG
MTIAGCWLGYAISADAWQNSTFIFCLFVAVSFLSGFFQVAMFALFMGVCAPAVAATQFSAYMALLNISSGIGSKLSGYVDTGASIPIVFAILFLGQIAMIPFVLFINSSDHSLTDVPEAPNKI